MVDATDSGLIGVRDRALILLGFAGAFRRSEMVRLDVEDLDFGRDGLTVTLRRSKTDQEGQGRKVGIPYGSNPETCPVRVLQSWMEQAGHNQRAGVPATQSARASEAGPFVWHRRCPHREEACRACGPGCCQVRRPLTSGRACHERSDCRRFRTLDHEPDRTSVGSDGQTIHPGRQSVPGQQRRQAGAVNWSTCFCYRLDVNLTQGDLAFADRIERLSQHAE